MNRVPERSARRARRRNSQDEGAAAVEMALVLGPIVALVALVAPLAILFYTDVTLGRAAGDTIRYGTSRTADERGGAGGRVGGGSLPTAGQIIAEAQRNYTGPGTLSVLEEEIVSVDDTTCASGRRLTITLRSEVDLGPFDGLLPGDFTNLVAKATSCEE